MAKQFPVVINIH